MPELQIIVEKLSKTFRVPVRDAGLMASLMSFLKPQYQVVNAVRAVSFEIHKGEVLGLIGPNGAGKTTMLKMLSGLLHPSEGHAWVSGYTPWRREPEYLRRIGMVMGNKSQMLWDIPALDTFQVLGEIYGLAPGEFKSTLDELTDLLALENVLRRPARSLSLGERMKCELAAGLLHRPAVLFLDEPTLGLDVSMQGRLRRFLAEYNYRNGVTIILTSHYMADVVALCSRVILIHEGSLLYDGELAGLAKRLAPFKLIRIGLHNRAGEASHDFRLPDGVDVIERNGGNLSLRVGRQQAPALTARLLESLPVADLSVEDPPIEAVIDQIYQDRSV
jgi:ABC-2 type transport system ATP-binding protein